MNECLYFLFIFSIMILRLLITMVLSGLPSFWSACACQMNFPKTLLNLVWCLVCKYSVTFKYLIFSVEYCINNSQIFWRVFPCPSSDQETLKTAILTFTIKIVTPWRANSLSFNRKRQSNVVIRILHSYYLIWTLAYDFRQNIGFSKLQIHYLYNGNWIAPTSKDVMRIQWNLNEKSYQKHLTNPSIWKAYHYVSYYYHFFHHSIQTTRGSQ